MILLPKIILKFYHNPWSYIHDLFLVSQNSIVLLFCLNNIPKWSKNNSPIKKKKLKIKLIINQVLYTSQRV